MEISSEKPIINRSSIIQNSATGGLILLSWVLVIEGLAWWWMHPAAAGQGEPVLVYRPEFARAPGARPDMDDDPQLPSGNPSSHPKFKIQNSKSTLTPLPEIVARSMPSLRCSAGTAARMDREDGITIHLAFFEWELADSTNVLEAFKHLPDQCMGSIGMTLTRHASPRSYQVGGESLAFDHTIFHDPRGVVVHAFKGTWVSGAANLLGDGLRGGAEQWRQIRWKAAIKRFRPAHARVAQGAVRGIANPDLAWQAFEEAMLNDLKFAK